MRAAILLPLLLISSAFANDYPGAPASVTAAYIEADGKGLALEGGTAQQLLRYTTWKDMPGWDSFIVIKSYDIGAVGWNREKAKDGGTADVQITYEVLGHVDGMKFLGKPSKEEVLFKLVKKNGKWKIVEPQPGPHIFVADAIAALETSGAKSDADGKVSLKKLRELE